MTRRAFTLLEVLLALAIFAIAVVGIIEAAAYQARSLRVAEETGRAVLLAKDLLAELRLVDEIDQNSGSGTFEAPNDDFEWSYEIADSDVSGLREVTIIISWSDGRARREHRIDTLLAER